MAAGTPSRQCAAGPRHAAAGHRLSVRAAGHPAQRVSPGEPAADCSVRPNPERSEARTATRLPWRPERERLPAAVVAGSRAGGVLALRAETPVPWFHRTDGPAWCRDAAVLVRGFVLVNDLGAEPAAIGDR